MQKDIKEIGLNITMIEDNPIEKDLILTIHLAYLNLFIEKEYDKLFVNQNGKFLDFSP